MSNGVLNELFASASRGWISKTFITGISYSTAFRIGIGTLCVFGSLF